MKHAVTIFKGYPFKKGQKIRIENSKRSGDWEVVDVTETKVTLKCPISKKEFAWRRFCYVVDEKQTEWPSD